MNGKTMRGSRRGRVVGTSLGALLMLGAVCQSASAADLSKRTPAPLAPVVAPGWTFSLNLYAWAAGLDGRVRTIPPLPAVDVNVSFGDVLENLNVALMGTAEARYDRMILFTDLIYSKLSPEKGFSVAGFPGRATIESESFIGLAAVGYRMVDMPHFSLDAFLGVRGFAMSNTITLEVPLASVSYGKSEQWIDGVVGARARYNFNNRLYAVALGFVGGGASNYQWDLYGGLGYAFNERWAAFAGYRAMKVDYDNGHFVYDALQHGPLLGVKITF